MYVIGSLALIGREIEAKSIRHITFMNPLGHYLYSMGLKKISANTMVKITDGLPVE